MLITQRLKSDETKTAITFFIPTGQYPVMASRENRQERVRKTAVREKLWVRFKLIGMDRGAAINVILIF